jgi:hypothetical protein
MYQSDDLEDGVLTPDEIVASAPALFIIKDINAQSISESIIQINLIASAYNQLAH